MAFIDSVKGATTSAHAWLGGAIGAGLVLVVLPSAALYFGVDKMSLKPSVGLPILAVFGVMILFGALALVATLFQRLELSDPAEALALPRGSIRAAIALALVVLFAIIAIMLYQSLSEPFVVDGKPYAVPGLTVEQLGPIFAETDTRVLAVIPESDDKTKFTVHLAVSPPKEATDFANQLLILIGTLLTSVTSFYFGSHAVPQVPSGVVSRADPSSPSLTTSDTSNETKGTVVTIDPEELLDGCGMGTVDPTPDDELPAARGGVA